MTNLVVNKKNKKRKKDWSDNQIDDILRLFDVLPSIFSREVKRWAIVTYEHGIYELPDELPNNLRLRIFGKWEISGKCLNFIEW